MPLLDLLLYDPNHPLLFCSGTFFLLFTLFVVLWGLLRRFRSLRLCWLLSFSLYYYYRCNGLYLLVLLGLAIADWAIALQLNRTSHSHARKLWLFLGIGFNLSALGYFKYTNFFLASLSLVSAKHFSPLDIFLPIGISFHVFQSLSYLVDVYRRSLEPTKSLLEYALFLSFFPQVVAGPIVRAGEFLPQLRAAREPSAQDINLGLLRIFQGVAKKALLADYVGLYSDLVFSAPRAYSGPEILLGLYAYTAQIYLDFSGYSDIAIGLARLLGIQFPENFASPYRATNITEFWHRWHLSLSRFLRDYLYIPLGGNRCGSLRRYGNLLITMLLGGLWHGAAWTFVLWGGLHGLALALHKILASRAPRPQESPRSSAFAGVLGWFCTFHFVLLLWVLFRARSLDLVAQILTQLTAQWNLEHLVLIGGARRWMLLAVALSLALSLAPPRLWQSLQTRLLRAPWPVYAALLFLLVQLVLQFSSANIPPFIYFQF